MILCNHWRTYILFCHFIYFHFQRKNINHNYMCLNWYLETLNSIAQSLSKFVSLPLSSVWRKVITTVTVTFTVESLYHKRYKMERKISSNLFHSVGDWLVQVFGHNLGGSWFYCSPLEIHQIYFKNFGQDFGAAWRWFWSIWNLQFLQENQLK